MQNQLTTHQHDHLIHYYPSLSSTNTVLKEMARKDAPSGTVIVADQQTNGRGRLGRTFYSPQNTGLYLSILYRLQSSQTIADCTDFTMRAAVAASEAIDRICHTNTQIKWVNDLYLNGKKIAGILTESLVGLSGKTDSIILGIGINLYNPKDGFPDELSDIAGSVFGNRQPEKKLREKLIDELIHRLMPLPNAESAIEIYRQKSCLIGKPVILTGCTPSLSGTVTGFNPQGHLLLTDNDGRCHEISSGEVTLRLKNERTV